MSKRTVKHVRLCVLIILHMFQANKDSQMFINQLNAKVNT